MGTNLNFSRCIAAALAAALLPLAGCGSQSDKAGGREQGKPVVLTMANANGDSHELAVFQQNVKRLSGGTLRIEIRDRWRWGTTSNETGTVGDVRSGKVDLAWAGSRAFDSVGVKSFDALHAPLLIDSYGLEGKVLRSDLVGQMLTGLEPLGVVGVGILPGPLRHPLGVSRLVQPDDYRGKTLAISRSKVAEETFDALGATAKEIPPTGSIASLDGIEQQIDSIQGNGYDHSAKFLTSNVDLWPRPLVIYMNKKAYAALTKDQRDALTKAARNALPTMLKRVAQEDSESSETLCRRGLVAVKASPDDLTALRAAVQPVYDRLEADPQVRAAISRIQSMRWEAPSDPIPASCTGASTQPATVVKASPLDGIWEFTSTRDEFIKNNPAGTDIVSENYGHYKFRLDRGSLYYTQEAEGAKRWTKGRYTIDGHTVTFTVTSYGGEAPNGAVEKTGETFSFRWSLYKDQLRLSKAPGKISPENFYPKPWRRVGDVSDSFGR